MSVVVAVVGATHPGDPSPLARVAGPRLGAQPELPRGGADPRARTRRRPLSSPRPRAVSPRGDAELLVGYDRRRADARRSSQWQIADFLSTTLEWANIGPRSLSYLAADGFGGRPWCRARATRERTRPSRRLTPKRSQSLLCCLAEAGFCLTWDSVPACFAQSGACRAQSAPPSTVNAAGASRAPPAKAASSAQAHLPPTRAGAALTSDGATRPATCGGARHGPHLRG
eukprot:scaffold704_cov347-Prasinococcus_capsulatus_cf.AAC.11